jgi:hypothetical protein
VMRDVSTQILDEKTKGVIRVSVLLGRRFCSVFMPPLSEDYDICLEYGDDVNTSKSIQ